MPPAEAVAPPGDLAPPKADPTGEHFACPGCQGPVPMKPSGTGELVICDHCGSKVIPPEPDQGRGAILFDEMISRLLASAGTTSAAPKPMPEASAEPALAPVPAVEADPPGQVPTGAPDVADQVIEAPPHPAPADPIHGLPAGSAGSDFSAFAPSDPPGRFVPTPPVPAPDEAPAEPLASVLGLPSAEEAERARSPDAPAPAFDPNDPWLSADLQGGADGSLLRPILLLLGTMVVIGGLVVLGLRHYDKGGDAPDAAEEPAAPTGSALRVQQAEDAVRGLFAAEDTAARMDLLLDADGREGEVDAFFDPGRKLGLEHVGFVKTGDQDGEPFVALRLITSEAQGGTPCIVWTRDGHPLVDWPSLRQFHDGEFVSFLSDPEDAGGTFRLVASRIHGAWAGDPGFDPEVVAHYLPIRVSEPPSFHITCDVFVHRDNAEAIALLEAVPWNTSKEVVATVVRQPSPPGFPGPVIFLVERVDRDAW